MTDACRTRLAVLGSPIAHSKSPVLHAAAYAVLGLPWTYEAVESAGADLARFLTTTDDTWRGLSLTMPLKRGILPMLDFRDDLVELTGGANTVLFTEDGLRGYNTDVYGVTKALRDSGVDRVTTVQLLGAGATAASVIVAVSKMGAETIQVSTRSPGKVQPLLSLAKRLHLRVEVSSLESPGGSTEPDLVVSTLPGGAAVDVSFPKAVLARATFFDVAYDPWPTALASRWLAAGGHVVSGLEMLVNQALGQVRIFVSGTADVELANEHLVLAAMRSSVGLDG